MQPVTDAGWNFADAWERVAERIPNELAQRQGDREYTWTDFDRRADGIAATLLGAGVVEQDKVAHYLYNCPEYLESSYGAFKAGLAIANTNYRYAADELVYLWTNADAVAVIFHGTFVEQCEAVRDRVPGVRLWIWVDDGSGPCPEWAVPYEEAAASATGRVVAPWGRSGDHLLLLYTGGTTGMPKGVMWRQDDLFGALDASNRRRMPPEQDLDALGGRVVVGRPPQPARRATDARHRLLQRGEQPDVGRQRHDDGGPALRRRRAARHGRAVLDQLDVDRR